MPFPQEEARVACHHIQGKKATEGVKRGKIDEAGNRKQLKY